MKLFSTSNLLIPKILREITKIVIKKIKFLLFKVKSDKLDVIFDFWFSCIDTFLSSKKFNKVGSKENVTIYKELAKLIFD